jgi:hypothetical protein
LFFDFYSDSTQFVFCKGFLGQSILVGVFDAKARIGFLRYGREPERRVIKNTRIKAPILALNAGG